MQAVSNGIRVDYGSSSGHLRLFPNPRLRIKKHVRVSIETVYNGICISYIFCDLQKLTSPVNTVLVTEY